MKAFLVLLEYVFVRHELLIYVSERKVVAGSKIYMVIPPDRNVSKIDRLSYLGFLRENPVLN